MAEHFVRPPNWEWWIVGYFFLAGLAGGMYTIATMHRLWDSSHDEEIARRGFLWAFPLIVVCGIFLTIDLGHPLRFWHMLINTTPGDAGLNFKYWSPISIGSWALLLFSAFSFLSFLEALGRLPRLGHVFEIVGSIVALFLASYTGVVLSVSNQPVWSDSYAIGGLFVASALSGSAALLSWLSHYRSDATAPAYTEKRLAGADGWFVVLELLMIAEFFATIWNAGTAGRMLAMPWGIIWLLVLISLIPPLIGVARRPPPAALISAAGVLVGVLLLRFVVIFGAQF